jgi:phospholipid/cholesterol/gamma-HCH transport system permease protein
MYLLLLRNTFSKPEQGKIYLKRIFYEANVMGVESLGIVAIISTFTGAVTTLNTAYQLVTGLVPDTIIGQIVTNSTMLELSPTITCLVLAGKVGSSISTELGSMRVSEQIDAMEVMGVNSASYLILPKIIAAIVMFPLLITVALFLSVLGGYLIGLLTGIVPPGHFIEGARTDFKVFTYTFAIIKTFTFAFIISSVSSFQGYKVEGGSVDVGRASTKSVVYCSVLILFFDFLLAKLIL